MYTVLEMTPYPPYANSSALFQNVVTQISNTLTSFGLHKTNDTGQISASTVSFTQNASSQTSFGYEVRTFTDSLTASNPILFKIEYGYGDNNAIEFWMTAGTGSDGNGNLTGQVSTRVGLYSAQSGLTSNQNYYLSGANNRLTFSMCDGPNGTSPQVFGLERSKNTSGQDNTDGYLFFYSNGNSASGSSLIPASGTWQGLQPCWPAAVNYYNYSQTTNSMQNGNNIGVAIPIPFNFLPFNPGLNFLIYQGTDFGQYSQTSLSLYGTSHNYLAVAPSASPTIATNNSNINTNGYNNTHILMRYE